MAFGKIVRVLDAETNEGAGLPVLADFASAPEYRKAKAVEIALDDYTAAGEVVLHVYKLEDGAITKVTPDDGWTVASGETAPAPLALYVWANTAFKLFVKVATGTVTTGTALMRVIDAS